MTHTATPAAPPQRPLQIFDEIDAQAFGEFS
jgi:hypothetical protein